VRAFAHAGWREIVGGQRKVETAMTHRSRIAVCAAGVRIVLVATVVSGCHGGLHVHRGHRAAASGHAHIRQRLCREGKRNQQSEKYPE
jgi:hypothetical protein